MTDTVGFEKIAGLYDLALKTARDQGFTHYSLDGGDSIQVPLNEVELEINPSGLLFKWGIHKASLHDFLNAQFHINYTK